jgi:hypothetical protein
MRDVAQARSFRAGDLAGIGFQIISVSGDVAVSSCRVRRRGPEGAFRLGHGSTTPPSADRCAPVTNRAASLARNANLPGDIAAQRVATEWRPVALGRPRRAAHSRTRRSAQACHARTGGALHR